MISGKDPKIDFRGVSQVSKHYFEAFRRTAAQKQITVEQSDAYYARSNTGEGRYCRDRVTRLGVSRGDGNSKYVKILDDVYMRLV